MGGWIDGCWEKNALRNEDYKTVTRRGPFSAVPTSAAAAPPTHSSMENRRRHHVWNFQRAGGRVRTGVGVTDARRGQLLRNRRPQ